MTDWLDKHIEEQREQRKILLALTGGVDPAWLQEMADFENWEVNNEAKGTTGGES